MAPQDYPLRSDGPTVKAGNYPFKLDPLNISILGEMPVCLFPLENCCALIRGRINTYCCQASHL